MAEAIQDPIQDPIQGPIAAVDRRTGASPLAKFTSM